MPTIESQGWDPAKGRDCVCVHESKHSLFFPKALTRGNGKVLACEFCSAHVRVGSKQTGRKRQLPSWGGSHQGTDGVQEMWAKAYSHWFSPGWKKMCFCQQMQAVPGSNLKSQADSHGFLASKITLLPVSCVPLQRFPGAVFSSSCLVSTALSLPPAAFELTLHLKLLAFCGLSCVIED